MNEIKFTPESILRNYSKIRQAQRLLTELAHVQADLAMILEYGDLEESLDVIMADVEDLMKEMRKLQRSEDASVRRSLAKFKTKTESQKPKKGKVNGNVISLKTKRRRKPKA